MSQTGLTTEGEKCKELLEQQSLSENDENYETEEEDISENIDTEFTLKRKNEKINFRRKSKKAVSPRLTISLRNRKSIRQTKIKKSAQNDEKKKIKKSLLTKKISVKRVETPKLGKRCRVGGKAKVNYPARQENQDKNDSDDDDSDSPYFSRISLGHFQQLKDKSGASTSYQNEEEKLNIRSLCQNATQSEKSEEEEFRELRMWGRNLFSTYFLQQKFGDIENC